MGERLLTAGADDKTQDVELGRQPISIVIPCRAEYVGLCRLLAGVVGAQESLQPEDIADLKLVVTEACTCFLCGLDGDPLGDEDTENDRLPDSLRVAFKVGPEAWEVVVSDPEGRYHIPAESQCSPTGTGGLGLTIIEALVDTVEHTDRDTEGSVIRLMKRTAPAPTLLA
jgi:anti-sigma regulatory factor (Ser/Thr protein kinase)